MGFILLSQTSVHGFVRRAICLISPCAMRHPEINVSGMAARYSRVARYVVDDVEYAEAATTGELSVAAPRRTTGPSAAQNRFQCALAAPAFCENPLDDEVFVVTQAA